MAVSVASVASVRFLRFGCDEQRHALFRPSYARCVALCWRSDAPLTLS